VIDNPQPAWKECSVGGERCTHASWGNGKKGGKKTQKTWDELVPGILQEKRGAFGVARNNQRAERKKITFSIPPCSAERGGLRPAARNFAERIEGVQ